MGKELKLVIIVFIVYYTIALGPYLLAMLGVA